MTFSEIRSAYLAAEDFSSQLLGEVSGVIASHGLLVLSSEPATNALWAQNTWHNPVVFSIESINDGAKKLKLIQRNWWLYSFQHHRRAKLIQEKLPHVSAKPLVFPCCLPPSPLGSWTLLDENTILASPDCSSLFPNGEVKFIEDRLGPPSRAYLKLYEAFTLMQKHPQPGEFCVDAGGSPGGWAWVVQQLGAQVLTIDRATPEPKILSLPNVKFRKGDAFALKPTDFDQVDWLLSDVVCFPNKLLEWASMWVESGKCENLVCTIKFKGKTDYGIVKKFSGIGGSRVAHLHHNRHELTWMYRPNWP